MDHWLFWVVFAAVTGTMMVLDLRVLQAKPHAISFKEAIRWTLAWIGVAVLFNLFLWYTEGPVPAQEFLTCYLTEYALSVDNMFVFLVIFSALAVPAESQRRVLLWGIIGALVMRGIFIVAGVELVQRFHWTTWILGGFLVLTGVKLCFKSDEQVDPQHNWLLRFARKHLRTTPNYEGKAFFVRHQGQLFATPLFICLLVIESSDVLFAVDSVPAALGITTNTAVLYTSNILAILGLRSLFFAVSELIKYLRFLNYGLSAILIFVGAKMLLAHWWKVSVGTSLTVVGSLLAIAVILSIVADKTTPKPPKDG
ncbi:MAG: TerC family protein [Planctomycetes bacterium]|nr:TerC family protein [Planctomycetota bacterium]